MSSGVVLKVTIAASAPVTILNNSAGKELVLPGAIVPKFNLPGCSLP